MRLDSFLINNAIQNGVITGNVPIKHYSLDGFEQSDASSLSVEVKRGINNFLFVTRRGSVKLFVREDNGTWLKTTITDSQLLSQLEQKLLAAVN